VELGEAMPGLAPEERTEANRLPGCQYAVWVRASYDPRGDALHFRADSDAKITRGLAALILQVFDGLPPREILAADVGFLDAIGLRAQLSVHRGNGLSALIEEIHGHARRHLPEEQASA
jgi:cysteine desulfuration protein SufE